MNKKKKIKLLYYFVGAIAIVIAITLFLVLWVIISNKAADINNQNEMSSIEGKKDTQYRAERLSILNRNAIKNSAIGDILTFGDYNGNTDWIILDKEEDKILIISRYAIDLSQYNMDYISVTWEKCSLRTFLNDEYLNSAFSKEERELILSTSLSNPGNEKYGISGGKDTIDKVFLLSIDEAKKYFASESDRKTTLKDGSSCWWWLRTPGYSGKDAASVGSDGVLREYGYYIEHLDGAVRPALWVDISEF